MRVEFVVCRGRGFVVAGGRTLRQEIMRKEEVPWIVR
jgi:hypothetical protein